MKCKYCDSDNLEERERPKYTTIMYTHFRCNDCKQVFFVTDRRQSAWCGSQQEHWQQLAVDIERSKQRLAEEQQRKGRAA